MEHLPGELVTHVSSFLGMRDRARLASTARRFRELAQSADWWSGDAHVRFESGDAVRSMIAFAAAHPEWRPEWLWVEFESYVDTIEYPALFPDGKRWPIAGLLRALPTPRELVFSSVFDMRLSALAGMRDLESLTLLFATDMQYCDLRFLRSLTRLTYLEFGTTEQRTMWEFDSVELPASLRSFCVNVEVVFYQPFLAGLRRLTALETLRLVPLDLAAVNEWDEFATDFTDVLSGMKSLTRLESARQFHELPPTVREYQALGYVDFECPHLTRLELTAAPLPDEPTVPALTSFPALRSLSMWHPVSAFGDMPSSLTHLDMAACGLRALPSGLPATLRHLDVSNNRKLFAAADCCLDGLRALTALETFEASDTGVEDPATLQRLFDALPLLCQIDV